MHTLLPLIAAAALHVASFAPNAGRRCSTLRLDAPLWLTYDWRDDSIPVAPRSTRPSPQELVKTAETYLGMPYSWGGTGQSGFDCSGFVNKVYAENGYDLPRVSREQVQVGLAVPRGAWSTGDLLFFSQEPGSDRVVHVGMYLNDAQFIHAAIGKGEVTYDRLTERYYAMRLTGARRVLALPPGRYSTLNGAAPAGLAFASEAGLDAFLDRQGATARRAESYTPSTRPATTTEAATDLLTEHAPGSRPAQLAPAFVKGAITEVGPMLLQHDATTFGVRVGGGSMQNRRYGLMLPEVSYFGHATALRVDVAAPFQLALGSGSGSQAVAGEWKTARDYLRVLRHVGFGQKESNLYIDVGRSASASLGDGQIMRYFTPNVASRFLPAYILSPNALSLSFDASIDTGGFEVFADDVARPRTVGAMAFVRPGVLLDVRDSLWRSTSIAVTYAADYDAPHLPADPNGTAFTRRSVHAFGF
ncbi:MAG TPA: C40 family peptidase, partial [Myxococcota bacterium]|nr:C40 family peptidase [Myxococcota bacterium]